MARCVRCRLQYASHSHAKAASAADRSIGHDGIAPCVLSCRRSTRVRGSRSCAAISYTEDANMPFWPLSAKPLTRRTSAIARASRRCSSAPPPPTCSTGVFSVPDAHRVNIWKVLHTESGAFPRSIHTCSWRSAALRRRIPSAPVALSPAATSSHSSQVAHGTSLGGARLLLVASFCVQHWHVNSGG